MSNDAARVHNVAKAQTSNKKKYGYVIERGKLSIMSLSNFQFFNL
jgi:hypothetical protein